MRLACQGLQNARRRRSVAKTHENKEIRGGEDHGSPRERNDDGELCALRQGSATLSGPNYEDGYAEPRRNLLERPENQAFPIILGG